MISGQFGGYFQFSPPNGPFSPFSLHIFLSKSLTVCPINAPLALTSFFNLGRGDRYDLGAVSNVRPQMACFCLFLSYFCLNL